MTHPPFTWRSWHLHLATPAVSALDRVLREVVTPVVADLDRPWFFIRYWQGGPHLRLRIADLEPGTAVVVRARLEALLARHGAPAQGEPAVHGAQYAAEAGRQARGETGANRQVDALREPGVYPQAYEPELERYGGPAVTGASEELFHHSSRLVAAIVPATDLARRRSIALRVAAASARPLGDGLSRGVFFAIGRDSWTMWARSYGYSEELIRHALAVDDRVVPTVVTLLDRSEADPAWLTQWQDGVADLVQTLDRAGHPVPGAVVSSHVHMSHNRLGLTTLDELRTYALLARAEPAPEGSVPDLAALAG